jgi:hypothetical protein
MKSKSRANRGQFSIIAALLVSIILVAAVIMTYSMIRYNPSRESPKVLASIGEVNLAIKRILEFTVGYYGSILQVTGNTTYAKQLAASYLQSGLVNIARSHPEWNPSFEVAFQQVSTRWFMPLSYSMGNISVIYSLSGLGIERVNYTTSSFLKVTFLEPMNKGQARFDVMREGNEPELRLSREDFFFYNYSYSDLTWNPVYPDGDPLVFSNGTYVLQIPSGVDQDLYSIQVADPRGMTVTAFYSEDSLVSGIPQYSYTFTCNSSLYSSLTRDTVVVEALQNGTLRWLGQNLLTNGKPIPPILVKALHVNQTVDGVNREVPFQVEDWGSKYRVPLGMTSNASVLSSRQMLVFLVNHTVQKVTLWWDGQDTATQTSYAWKNRYFVNDDTSDPEDAFLSNGILDLTVYAGGSAFTVTSTLGTSTNTAEFMRINGRDPMYGDDPKYVIYNGVVRDIVQAEAEWSGGISDCPNVYGQIYLTLPAKATYYTYALRLIFVNSAQSRILDEIRAIRLTASPGGSGSGECITENRTIGGFPVRSYDEGLFYNFSDSQTAWAHHWTEFMRGNRGSGIMFTNNSNFKLYTFDSIAGQKAGALYVDKYYSDTRAYLDFKPVAQFQASFTDPLDVTWHGAVVNFEDEPIYQSSDETGLWVMVEHPPIVAVN